MNTNNSNPNSTQTNTISTSEKGHAINVANFDTLITTCKGHGSLYNPVNETIQIPQLTIKFDLAKKVLNQTEAKKALLNTAINERITEFQDLETLCTQVTNSFAVSGASKLDINDLKAINKKIQGPSKKKTTANKEAITPAQISTSQQSYDSQLNFFKNFIQYLESKPIYKPNEEALRVNVLQAKYEVLYLKNKNVDNALFNYNTVYNDRNRQLYDPLTGLVQISKEVKRYARSIFKSNSPEFKQLNSIEFKVIKK
jgi:hypothetical protein